MSEFKAEPGRFYRATVRGEPAVAVVLGGQDGWDKDEWMSAVRAGGRYIHPSPEVTDIRPLVVLDLTTANAKLLREAADAYEARYLCTGERAIEKKAECIREMARQIEAQTKPPKPPEPTGLGAVVEDAAGQRWVKFTQYNDGAHWASGAHDGTNRTYAQLDAVKVLSEGVPS